MPAQPSGGAFNARSNSARSVVVTGASTGIGRAIAASLVRAGVPVFASMRRTEDADALKAEFGALCFPLIFDVRDPGAIAAAAETVRQSLAVPLGGLVNNAGIAVPGPLEHLTLEAFRDQIEVNVTGVLAVTQAFLPLLRASGAAIPGRIVNISSVSGVTTYPFLGAYSAAKFALEALSDAMRREFAVHGIPVSVVQPGGVATPIWEKSADGGAPVPVGSPYRQGLEAFRALGEEAGRSGIPAERVGDLVLAILHARRPKPRYVITGNPLFERVLRRVPTTLLDRLMARRLGLRRQD